MKAWLSIAHGFFMKNNALQGWWKTYAFAVPFQMKFYFRSFLLISIFSTSFISVHALGDSSLKAWIDFMEEDSTAFVKGLFVNLKEKPETFDWEMNLHKESFAGKSNESFNGTFVAEPSIPMMISEVEVDLKKREYFVIILNVFNKKNELVGTDTLRSETIDPTLKPPPPPKIPLAKNDLEKPAMKLDAIEIDGLILDETRSKIGRDFYEFFYSKWIAPAGATDFLITIKELPPRGIGARVSIQVNDDIILSRFLQPRTDIVEQQAIVSINAIRRYLVQNESLKQSMDSADVSGSGIY